MQIDRSAAGETNPIQSLPEPLRSLPNDRWVSR